MPLLLWGLALGLAGVHGHTDLAQGHVGSELRTKLHPVSEHVSVPGGTGTPPPVPIQTGLRGALNEVLPRHGVHNLITRGTGLDVSVKHVSSRFLHPLAMFAIEGNEDPAKKVEQNKRRPPQAEPSANSATTPRSRSLQQDLESTNDAAGTTQTNSSVLDEEEEEWTWTDHAAFAMLMVTRIFLVVVLVLVAVFCYCCGIGEDLILCCGVFAGFGIKTKMQIFFFLLLNVAAFLVVWQIRILRPVMYMGLVFALHGCFCCGCILVVVMELTREARKTFRDGVQFLGTLDDKVDDMLDYLGLSEASSDDDVATTCWGTPVRRAEKKAPEPPKIEEVKEQPPSPSWWAWTKEPEAKEVTKAKGRPLVGERQSKKKKPKVGKAKTVK